MATPPIVIRNALGEASACLCGGMRLRLGCTSMHIAAADVAQLKHLVASFEAMRPAAHAPSATASPQQVDLAAPMTADEAKRFGAEGPIRTSHPHSSKRTLH